MSKKSESEKVIHAKNFVSLWDEAIYDAERMVKEAKEKAARLRRAIKTFENLRDSGVAFPTGKPERNEVKA